jgi:probable phosphoglycerate mutase
MERTVETANILAAAEGVNVEVDSRFNELDFGAWQGTTFAKLMEYPLWAEYNQYRSIHRPPGGESVIEVQGRAWKGIQSLCERFGQSTVLVVSHADVIRSILVLALGMPPDNILRLDIPPASISELSVGLGAPVVHRIGIV